MYWQYSKTLRQHKSAISESRQPYQYQQIRSFKDLEGLREDWFSVWEKDTTATPFQSPDWILPWCKYFLDGELQSLAVRFDGAAVGFLPFYIHTTVPVAPSDASKFGVRGLRQLLVLGTGAADYLDVLAAEGFEDAVTDQMFKFIQTIKSKFDFCCFQDLQMRSHLLQAPTPVKTTEEVSIHDVCPVLHLSKSLANDTFEEPELSQLLLPSMVDQIENAQRRAEKTGTLEIVQANEANYEQLFETLVKLHLMQSEFYKQETRLTSKEFQNFLKDVVKGFLSANSLYLYCLKHNGIPIASFLGFLHSSKLYRYLSGFHSDFSELHPDLLLFTRVMEKHFASDVREFHFSRGAEPFKYAWGAKNRFNHLRKLWV